MFILENVGNFSCMHFRFGIVIACLISNVHLNASTVVHLLQLLSITNTQQLQFTLI